MLKAIVNSGDSDRLNRSAPNLLLDEQTDEMTEFQGENKWLRT
jgi:hypothetical protein